MRHFFLIFLTLLLSACGKSDLPSPYHAIDISWQHPQPDLHLTDFNGTARTLSDWTDKVVVIFFGYTHCPDVCPTTLADLAQVTRLLDEDASKTQVLFITLDPERDSPALLAKFVPSFDPSFLGLYGSVQATAQAAQAFGVNYAKQTDNHGGYTLDHTDGVYLIGLGGKPLLLAPYHQPAQLMVEDIRLLLSSNR